MKDHPPGAALALALAIVALPVVIAPMVGALVGAPMALLALIIASWSRRRVRAHPDAYRESAMASAATVCALVALVLAVLVFLGWALLLTMAHGAPTPDDPLRF